MTVAIQTLPGMARFVKWLDSATGNGSKLAAELGVTRALICNVRNGRANVKLGWIATIVRMSNGKVRLKDLIPVSNTPTIYTKQVRKLKK